MHRRGCCGEWLSAPHGGSGCQAAGRGRSSELWGSKGGVFKLIHPEERFRKCEFSVKMPTSCKRARLSKSVPTSPSLTPPLLTFQSDPLVKQRNKNICLVKGEACCLFCPSRPPPGGLQVTCEYMAQQEGVLCEEVLLLSESNDDVCVKVKVHARVMGKVHLQVTPDASQCHVLFFCHRQKTIFSLCAAALLWFCLVL